MQMMFLIVYVSINCRLIVNAVLFCFVSFFYNHVLMKFESCNNEGNEFKSRVKNDVSTNLRSFSSNSKVKRISIYMCKV